MVPIYKNQQQKNNTMTNNYINLKAGFIRLLFSLVIIAGLSFSSFAQTIKSQPQGGLWSDPNTWIGGSVPLSSQSVLIADGSVVTVNTAVTISGLTVGEGTSGVMQWSTASSLTVNGGITIATGAFFAPYASSSSGFTITFSGNLVNNGTTNLALSALVTTGAAAQSIGGTGNFIGDGTSGIIKSIENRNRLTNNIHNNIITIYYWKRTVASAWSEV